MAAIQLVPPALKAAKQAAQQTDTYPDSKPSITGQPKVYAIVLPVACYERLLKPTKGQGGWQTLIGQLQTMAVHTADVPMMQLPEAMLHRLIPAAVKYGSGGYQSLIRWILCLVLEQHRLDILGKPAPAITTKGAVTLKAAMQQMIDSEKGEA
jgi:hypothetical protein